MPPDILINIDYFHHLTRGKFSPLLGAETVKRPNGLCYSQFPRTRDPDLLAFGRRSWSYHRRTPAPPIILKCSEVNPTFPTALSLKIHYWLAIRKQAPQLFGGKNVKEVRA